MREPLPDRSPSAVVWDMDGTLIDSSSAVPDAFIETVTALGGAVHSRAEVVALYSLGPPRAMLSRMLERPCRDEEVDLYHEILARCAAQVTTCPGVEAALDRLRHLVPMAVFTGASRRAADILLSAAGLRDHFPVVVGGDEIERPKPDPQGIQRACSLLRVPTGACVYVGDAPTDLEAARRAGALAAAAGWGHLYDASARADLVLDTPDDLAARLLTA
ncbi:MULTISPECIES: HAD family hydrolase [Streptomyces]|uniref:Haloacid dehalogenase n=2 Tax=Streptomyces TaxID=1883 RepID=A0A514JLA8_9ACTN|nr:MULTISPECIES: HAD-IA family hydrolase [Streptomyces]MBA8975815.1 HAD superfamily hydrolase (TIGR01549 family) [Streptomyces calvus]MYS30281.1 HAD-IA family hydrolase [Streptomyces sp. SID7804]QDI68110.1 haloacid dehalogenase [Streptomyces calvus]